MAVTFADDQVREQHTNILIDAHTFAYVKQAVDQMIGTYKSALLHAGCRSTDAMCSCLCPPSSQAVSTKTAAELAKTSADIPEVLLSRHHAREVASLAKLIRHKRLRRLRALSSVASKSGRIAPSEAVEVEETEAKLMKEVGGWARGWTSLLGGRKEKG